MRRFYLLCLLAATCGDAGPNPDAELTSRRAALGLGKGPLSFAEAMAWMGERTMEGFLTRVGSRRLHRDDVLDAALRVENVLARADLASAGKHRASDPGGFDRLHLRTRDLATALARAIVAGEDGKEEGATLLTACVECHLTYRKGP
ncbi:MAG: hypothetical protein ACYTG3_11145 [Planctomycetota bacterium]|jgi:hypothetical protein